MARRDPAFQTQPGGPVPARCDLQLDHSEPQQQALKPSTEDMTLVGLRLGNWMSAAVYGVRGEYR